MITPLNELHVIALSGGKDSTAMALRLAELHPDREFVRIITPTGNELPDMYSHWKLLGDILGPLTPIVAGTLDGIINKEQMIPNWRARFCTRMLKIEPYAAWLMKQSEQYKTIYSYVGIRADEEERQAGDYTSVPNAQMVFPMRDWGWDLNDVLDYLAQRDISIPRRTDCALCFFQKLAEWWVLWKEYPDLFEEGVKIEKQFGHTFRSPGRDTWPADLESLRAEFESGRIPRGVDMQQDMIGSMQCRVCRM